jgi:hypothetical protein
MRQAANMVKITCSMRSHFHSIVLKDDFIYHPKELPPI